MSRVIAPPLDVQMDAAGIPYEREYLFAKERLGRLWRFDYALPYAMLGIEIEGGVYIGGAHTRGAHFESDCEKYNAAVILGWRVLRFTPRMERNGSAISTILATLEGMSEL